jgi:hypothetical protein
MSRRWLVSLLLLSSVAFAHELPDHRQGFITSITSATSFTVDGAPVTCNDHTRLGVVEPGKTTYTPATTADLVLAEHVEIEGHRQSGQYIADTVRVARPPQQERTVHGHVLTLVGSQLQRGPDGAWRGVVKIDGRDLLVEPGAAFSFGPATEGTVPAGVWADYEATWKPDYRFHLNKLSLRESQVLPDEIEFRKHASERITPPDATNNGRGSMKTLLSRHIALISSPETQRMESIGERLLPEYQKQLPEADPRKIHFRFFVADVKQASTGWGLPGGEIVLPKGTLEKLGNNDAAIAAEMARLMANVLEERAYHAGDQPHRMRNRAIAGAALAGVVTGMILSPEFAATELITGSYYANGAFESASAQTFAANCRIAMQMMQAAGFDPVQLPLTMTAILFSASAMDKVGEQTPLYYAVLMREVRENYGRPPAPSSEN